MQLSKTPENVLKCIEEELSCSICLHLAQIPCLCRNGHIFCRSCLENWIVLSNTCPICRTEIPLERLEEPQVYSRIINILNKKASVDEIQKEEVFINILYKSDIHVDLKRLIKDLFIGVCKSCVLYLQNLELDNHAIHALMIALNGSAVRRLYLDSNQINDMGAYFIGKSLKENLPLLELYIHSNEIGDEGVKFIVDGIGNNKYLNTLTIHNNKFSQRGFNSLLQLKHLKYISFRKDLIDKGEVNKPVEK